MISSRKANLAILGTLLLIFSFSPNWAKAEGTAQLMPNATNPTIIQIWDNNDPLRNSFTYNAPADKRLYFHVDNHTNEIVYFGFGRTFNGGNDFNAANWNNGSNDRLRFRIRRPDGTIFAGYNNVLIPNAGAGFIDTHAQAVAGPAQLVGAAGYNALYLDPDQNGDWWVEFNRGADPNTTPVNKTGIRFFDITVATGVGAFGDNAGNYVAGGTSNTGTAINGRVYSQAWDVNMMGSANPFLATLFVYTPDQIVLSVDFNGMQPFGFVISCNSTGTDDTGDVVVDRRSVAFNSTRPEYPIFLNDPDPNVYPTGVIPTLDPPEVEVTLCTNYEISLTVNAPGFIEVLLDLDNANNNCASPVYVGNGGYNFNSKDRLLGFNAPTAGTYTISWDGLDGCGNVVPTGTNISLRARLQLGLTHLPLYDVEGHPNGYTVALVRPLGPPPPNLYWDDSAVGGTVQLVGAVSPAHNWTLASNFGNNRTINTWFFIQESQDQVVSFVADNTTFELTANSSGDLCESADDLLVTFEVVFSDDKFDGTSINYALQQSVPDPNYTFAPYPDITSYIADAGTFVDGAGIVKRRVYVTYQIIPNGSPPSLDVQLNFTASANPDNCPAPITESQFNSCEIPLPVALTRFEVENRQDHNLLTWQTSSESDNRGFYVERSFDEQNFQTLGFVQGRGTTSQNQNYQFADYELQQGWHYYRFKQVDWAGSYAYSPIIGVWVGKENAPLLYYYQAGETLHFKNANPTQAHWLAVYDVLGRKVFETSLEKGTTQTEALLSFLAKGTYIAEVRSANFRLQVKFMR
jgi:hypothetical protein